MKKILKPFQQAGARFLADRRFALLADEMGLGKTVQALAAAGIIGVKHVLVVCPASVRSNWHQEAKECGLSFDRLDVISYNGAVSTPYCPLYQLLVLDEAHYLKTPDSQRTRAIFQNGTGLARRADRIWALTGTPVLNRPRELYPLLKVLHSKGIEPYTTWGKFTQHFCGAYWEGPGRGMNTKGATNMEELRERLKGFMLRREKAEVAPELPPRIVSRPVLDLTPADLSPVLALEDEMGDREAYLSPVMEDFSQLGDMARLSKAIGVAKVKRVATLVEDLIDSQDPDNTKIVIFARHRDVIKGLCEELKGRGPVSYVGGMNDRQKVETVKKFIGDRECQVFVGQIQAAGTGINGLQKVCRDVVFAELSWVPGEMAQAIDRCHRIGQTRDAVNVYLPHVPGTLESAMLEVQKGKEAVIGALVGGASPSSPSVKDPLEGII